jgi:hypothetical protein
VGGWGVGGLGVRFEVRGSGAGFGLLLGFVLRYDGWRLLGAGLRLLSVISLRYAWWMATFESRN